jgi:hypothetical protein
MRDACDFSNEQDQTAFEQKAVGAVAANALLGRLCERCRLWVRVAVSTGALLSPVAAGWALNEDLRARVEQPSRWITKVRCVGYVLVWNLTGANTIDNEPGGLLWSA